MTTPNRLLEAICVALVALTSLLASIAGLRLAHHVGVVPFFYQQNYEPAIRIACGQPFGADPRSLSGEMTDFLDFRRSTLSCAAVPPPQQLNPYPPTRIWYHLLVTVGAVWRVTGISWSVIEGIAAAMMSMSAVCVYGILRMWIPRAISTPLAVVSILPGLRYLLYLRDINKAPFILASLFVVAWLASRDLSRTRFAAVMAGIGLLLGVGYGFRPDVLIALPLLATTAVLFRPGPVKSAWQSGMAGSVLMASAFALAASPALSALGHDIGSCHWHFALLGLSDEHTRQLGLSPTSVSWFPRADDLVVWRSVDSYAERALGEREVGFCTAAYDRASKALYLETITRFPGEIVRRGLAAAEGTIAYGFWGLLPMRRLDAAALAPWIRYSVQAASIALWGVVILTLLANDVRTGLFACCALGYLCAYPIVQFHPRHFFHLAFLAWLPVGLVLGVLIAERGGRGEVGAWRTRGARLATTTGWLRAAATLVGLIVLGGLTLIGAERYQRGKVAELLGRYRNARGEPASVLESTEENGRVRTTYAPVIPPEGRTVTGRMLRLDLGGSKCTPGPHELTLVMSGPDPASAFEFARTFTLVRGLTPTALLAPIYFERARIDRVSTVLPAGDRACLIGATWLDSSTLPRLWVGATIDSGD
jgi:hypothetical protein